MIVTTKTKLRNKTQRSARGHIIALVDYLMKDEDRVKNIWTSHEINTINRNEIKGALMATASLNPRARNPMMHVIFSFRPEEQFTYAEFSEMLGPILSSIGADQHQWIAVEHDDKDRGGGREIHVAINRIHPVTFESNPFKFSQLKMMKAKADIEHKKGWDQLNYPEFQNAPFRIAEDGQTIEDRRGKRGQAFAKAGALAKERYQSGMSMESYLNETFVQILGKNHNSVKGWKAEELHEILGSMGLEIRRQGGGAILIWHHQSESGEVVQERRKLSAVEGWKFAKLQKVLDGGFKEPSKNYIQPVGFQHSPTNPKTQDQAQKDIQEVKAQIQPTQAKLKKRRLYKEVIAYNNTPTVMAATRTDAAYISRTKSIQAKRKLEQKKIEAEKRKANAEFLRSQSERLWQQQQDEARQLLERIRIEKEAEEQKTKASPQAASAPSAFADGASDKTQFEPTDQVQSNITRAEEVSGLDVQDDTPDDLVADRDFFIALIKEGQIKEAMQYATETMNFYNRDEYLYYVPQWWYQTFNEEIPEDWLNYYGPPEEKEIMQPEPEDTEIWR